MINNIKKLLSDKDYIDITELVIWSHAFDNIIFIYYLNEKEVDEIIIRLKQNYDVGYAKTTYYVNQQVILFLFC